MVVGMAPGMVVVILRGSGRTAALVLIDGIGSPLCGAGNQQTKLQPLSRLMWIKLARKP
jgi:hypothetical protein